MNEKRPVKIIFDTDMGGDCDDAGTLAMLHRLCDKGEAELLAVTHCDATPYVAGCIDAINICYGRQVPVGINYKNPKDGRGVYAGALCDSFPNRYPAETYGTDKGAPRHAERSAQDAGRGGGCKRNAGGHGKIQLHGTVSNLSTR